MEQLLQIQKRQNEVLKRRGGRAVGLPVVMGLRTVQTHTSDKDIAITLAEIQNRNNGALLQLDEYCWVDDDKDNNECVASEYTNRWGYPVAGSLTWARTSSDVPSLSKILSIGNSRDCELDLSDDIICRGLIPMIPDDVLRPHTSDETVII
jgi:hypothetical protein